MRALLCQITLCNSAVRTGFILHILMILTVSCFVVGGDFLKKHLNFTETGSEGGRYAGRETERERWGGGGSVGGGREGTKGRQADKHSD